MFKWDGFGVLFSISTGTKKSGSKKFKQQRWTLSMYKKTEKSDEKEARTKKIGLPCKQLGYLLAVP